MFCCLNDEVWNEGEEDGHTQPEGRQGEVKTDDVLSLSHTMHRTSGETTRIIVWQTIQLRDERPLHGSFPLSQAQCLQGAAGILQKLARGIAQRASQMTFELSSLGFNF